MCSGRASSSCSTSDTHRVRLYAKCIGDVMPSTNSVDSNLAEGRTEIQSDCQLKILVWHCWVECLYREVLVEGIYGSSLCKLNLCCSVPAKTKILLYKKSISNRVMVFNATFNNISIISWPSALLVEETGVPGENHRPTASHWQILSHNVVSNTLRHERDSNSQL